MPQIEFHPLAELFPLMEGAEFDALVADIKQHGLREPVVLHDDKILDGRNRYRACAAAGIDAIYEEWDCQGSIQAFVISKNLHRRHLNESQRAMVAAKISNRPHGDQGEVENQTSLSAGEAANLLSVSRDTVFNAKTVLRGGTPEEIEAIQSGEAAVATIARQIRKQVPKEKRAKDRAEPIAQSGKNPERIQRQQMQAEIWAQLSEAILGLTALPAAADVVEIVNGNLNRKRVVKDRLPRALQWLTEFSDAWSAND